jgi:hypothetical protein
VSERMANLQSGPQSAYCRGAQWTRRRVEPACGTIVVNIQLNVSAAAPGHQHMCVYVEKQALR